MTSSRIGYTYPVQNPELLQMFPTMARSVKSRGNYFEGSSME